MTRRALVLALLAALPALAACGRRGPLERPPEWDRKPAADEAKKDKPKRDGS
jgi:predicted small lipoprotein YifL